MAVRQVETPPEMADNELVKEFVTHGKELLDQIHKVVIGQDRIIAEMRSL